MQSPLGALWRCSTRRLLHLDGRFGRVTRFRFAGQGSAAVKIPLADAADRLDELVRRAEAGEEVVLTEDGRAVVRLEPIAAPGTAPAPDRTARAGTLAEFLLESPLRSAEIDLQRFKDG